MSFPLIFPRYLPLQKESLLLAQLLHLALGSLSLIQSLARSWQYQEDGSVGEMDNDVRVCAWVTWACLKCRCGAVLGTLNGLVLAVILYVPEESRTLSPRHQEGKQSGPLASPAGS